MALHRIPVNKFNPLDELGIIHNNALDYFAKNAPDNYTLNDILSLSGTSVLNDMRGKNNFTREDLIKLEAISGAAFNIMFLPDNGDPNFIPINVDAIISAGGFNTTQANFIKQLLNPSTKLSLAQYGELVVQIEKNILASNLTSDEQMQLLPSTAVGKATVPYWIKQSTDPKSPWTPVIGGGPAAAAKPWWKYVLADLGGALSGIGGGPIGAAGGAAGGTIIYAVS